MCGVASSIALAALAMAATGAPPPTVDSVVSDYIAARGGLAKIRSLQTLRQKGHAFAGPGREAVVVRELKRPGKVRFEFTHQGITGVYVTDGTKGWQVAPFHGDASVHPMSEDAVADAMEQADIEGPLIDWKAKGHVVELAGRETIGGHDAFKLKVTHKSGGTRFDYIDAKTHYEVRTEMTREIGGRPVRMETSFADHRMTNGILFPRTNEDAAAGRPNPLRIVVDSIELNPTISDERFKRPAGLD